MPQFLEQKGIKLECINNVKLFLGLDSAHIINLPKIFQKLSAGQGSQMPCLSVSHAAPQSSGSTLFQKQIAAGPLLYEKRFILHEFLMDGYSVFYFIFSYKVLISLRFFLYNTTFFLYKL